MPAESPSWYGARLVYLIGKLRKGDRIRVQEDFWLLQAKGADEAYQKVLSAAEAATPLGQALADGRITTFQAFGLDRFISIFFPDDASSTVAEFERGPERLKGTYSVYEFIGIRDLHYIGNALGHRVQIDRYNVSLRRGGALVQARKGRGLLAFHPSGPAYVGRAARLNDAKLYERFHWYLAEELFEGPTGQEQGAARQVQACLVLIEADGPDQAYELGLADGMGRAEADFGTRSVPTRFLGLRQLSLITDKLRDFCIIRTDEYRIPVEEIRTLVKAKADMRAFRDGV